jgi:hypothetical protein
MIALICGLLCIGVGVTLQRVFGDTLQCFLDGLQGSAPASCGSSTGGGGSGGGGGGGSGGGGGVLPVSPSPAVTATPTPTP